MTQVFRHGDDFVVLKGISVRLTDSASLATCFDPLTLSYRAIWQDGFIQFHPFRWGSSRNARLQGEPWFIDNDATNSGIYLGYYRHGDAIVFRFEIDGVEILDQPSASADNSFVRTLEFPKGSKAPISLHLGSLPDELNVTITGSGAFVKGHSLTIAPQQAGAVIHLQLSRGEASKVTPSKPSKLIEGGKARWPQRITMPGKLGKPRTETSAYVTDTLAVPYDNPYKAIMQLTGIAFYPNGDALVLNLHWFVLFLILGYEWFITRTALGVRPMAAAGFVVLDFVIDVIIQLMVRGMTG